jgi:hypothetical protein
MKTYMFGYNNARLTLPQLESRESWMMLHPELRRRLVALFDASQKAGCEVGLGGGGRSSQQQTILFKSRYKPVDCPGEVRWDGKCWKHVSGASAAPPGLSYHEETTGDGFALAADLVGDLVWMNKNCSQFGLLHFGNVNKEPWHVQPVEVPKSRKLYSGQKLDVWPISGQPVVVDEDDMKTAVLVSFKEFANVWLVGSGPAINVTPELFAHYKALGVPSVVMVLHPQMLKGLMAQSNLVDTDLVSTGK